MATTIPLPKLGNTVESSIIVRWRKQLGEAVNVGDVLCEVETDKAVMEVESPAGGVLLALYAKEGDDVPVLAPLALIGEAGESVAPLQPSAATQREDAGEVLTPPSAVTPNATSGAVSSLGGLAVDSSSATKVSPRARKLANAKGVTLELLSGSGPDGRIIERDVQAAFSALPKLSPVAQAKLAAGDFVLPEGASGRILSRDLLQKPEPHPLSAGASPKSSDTGGASPRPYAPLQPSTPTPSGDGGEVLDATPLKGARKIIAQRMLESLQTTAQLTLNASTDARALQAYRAKLKASNAALGLQSVTINDLILFAVSRTLPQFPDLNALFQAETITRYNAVHLGIAVDTPRGLLVPVVRNAHTLTLKGLADQAHTLAVSAQDGKIAPDALSGGTFTVTNLGAFGVESFTPVLNPPQVAILGVGNINLKPVEADGAVQFIAHIGLSLTINHQVVDGAPGARFLQALCKNIAQIDLLLAI